MAKSKRVRWECPNGLHPGKLGSTRPKADATVRFCLDCSEIEGVLVQRVVPSLERTRAKGKERSRKKSEAKKAREAEPFTVEGVDVRVELKRMIKAIGMKRAPRLKVYRTNKRHTTGRAWSSGRIHLSMPKDCTRLSGITLLIHELAHHILFWNYRLDGVTRQDRGDRRTSHGPEFLQTMKAIALATYGVDCSVDLGASYHDLHKNIREALKGSAWFKRTEEKAQDHRKTFEAKAAKTKTRKEIEYGPNQFRITPSVVNEVVMCSFDTITPEDESDPRGGLREWFDENTEMVRQAYVLTIPDTPDDHKMANIFAGELQHTHGLSWEAPARVQNALEDLHHNIRDFLRSTQ